MGFKIRSSWDQVFQRLEEDAALFIVKAQFLVQQELSNPGCGLKRCEVGTQKRGIHWLCEVMSITEESDGSDGQAFGAIAGDTL